MKTFNTFLFVLLTSFFLTACGGGGGSLERNTTTTPTTPEPDPDPTQEVRNQLTLSITDSSGVSNNRLTEQQPLTVTASVVTQDGQAVSDALVTFSFDSVGLADFNNDTGTALTDANGIARIGLIVGELAGDGLVIASVDNADPVSIGFSSEGIQQQEVTPATITLFASSTQLPSSGSDSIELIAEVKNAENVLLSNVEVSFAARESASLEIIDTQTRDDGTARALLKTTNNQENREITVTATSGSLIDSLVIDVVGTEITLSGPSSITIGNDAEYTAFVADSNGVGVANQAFSVSTMEQYDWVLISSQSDATGSTGQADFTIRATQAGEFTLQISALGFDFERKITVQQDDFALNMPNNDPDQSLPQVDVGLDPDDGYEFSVLWLKNGAPFENGDVAVTASRGVLESASAQTDENGIATFTIRSSSAGNSVISAFGSVDGVEQVTSTERINFVSTEVHSIYLDASPDIIGPDGQTSTISAVVRDINGNVVENERVTFNLNDVSGGTLSPNFSETDSNGIASVTYTSNANSSFEAVVINAQAQGVSARSARLTVAERAFDVSIGTGNELIEIDDIILQKDFAVFVSDSSGGPIEGITLSASVTPIATADGGGYLKGRWIPDPTGEFWVQDDTTLTFCPNEDSIDPNGILDESEDTNTDGELTPGIIGTINFKENIATTDASGRATLEYQYPKNYGAWTAVEIKVFSQSDGSEVTARLFYTLDVLAEDINNIEASMPENPFGQALVCEDPN